MTQRWLGPPVMTTGLAVFAIVLMLLAVAGNSWSRLQQLYTWQDNPAEMEFNAAPLFSTADAPFFMVQASAIKSGRDFADLQRARNFPNLVEIPANQNIDTAIRSRPLLSVLLAYIAKGNGTSDLLWSGNLMIIVSAGLTALMIAICFGSAGYWHEGAVAAIGGGLSSAYLVRSSIGRIDTDQMNLGFMYLMFGLAVLAGRANSRRSSLLWCIAAGILANIFSWWYGKPELIAMGAIALAWLLVCLQRHFLTTIFGTAIFVSVSGLTFFNPFESTYLQTFVSAGDFIFPNALETVTEVQTIPFTQVILSATGSIEMGIVCLTGLTLFLVKHPVVAIAYGPLIAFGLLNFVIGNRAIFYSAPIMWFGAAFLMTTTARFIATSVSESGYMPRRDQAATMLATSLALFIAWVNSPTDYMPRPSFPKPVLEGLASLKSTADPANSIVATWWDYGYASTFFNALPTFHDGGSQTTPTTHFVATSLLDADQSSSVGKLKFLSTRGHKGITAEKNLSDLKTQFERAINAPSPDLYLVVTSQMAGWMGSISRMANWNIETGKPITLRGNPNGPLVNFERLNCRLAGYPETLTCSGMVFDLVHGLVNGARALAGWAHSQDGAVVRNRTFNHEGDIAVQIVQIGNRINVFLMHRQLFESSFNELFYLGQINHPSISLHYDNYPHIRIYKINGKPAG